MAVYQRQPSKSVFGITAYFCSMEHEKFMRRCLELASLGLGTTRPNPLVGAVVVHENKIIGEGWHRKSGEAHAEVNAIAKVVNQDILKESTLYVNLEPCAHFGKTPPCSDLIIEKKIPRVVVATRDPFAEVNGRGIEKMKAAGVEVTEDILGQEAKALNRRFFTFHQKRRPYIILKWAQTMDGFMDRKRGQGEHGINWITAPETRSLVHRWRAEEAAIMVGGRTVLNDNPSLSVRDVAGQQPLRVVVDLNNEVPENASVFNEKAPTLYFYGSNGKAPHGVVSVKLETKATALTQVMEELYQRDIQSVLVEGGARLIQGFIDQQLWDEARVLTGNCTFGGGLAAPKMAREAIAFQKVGVDSLSLYRP